MKRDHINIYIDADVLAWLQVQAEQRRCSLSQIIRDYLLAAFEARKK